MEKPSKYMLIVSLIIFMLITVHAKEEDEGDDELKPGKPVPVTYDGRSILINGKREIFFSGSVHYPRAPEAMWGELLDKCKEGGLNMIQTYVFWNIHEPEMGKFNFTGNYDVIKFIRMVAERGMWVTLRIGPFIQAEWNSGGLPFWLRMEHNITYRTNNEPFKKHMGNWVTKVINMMKDNNLFASQGGPILMSQIENEYDHVKEAYDDEALKYVQWAANMAIALKTGVPWIMCKSKDAPGEIINSCNGRQCGDTFTGPNAPNKPSLWTENWTAQYRAWGDPPSQRATEDISFSVARWFSKNGSHVNYYMYYGGTNYGRTSAAFITNRYYDEAPLDEYGLIRGPKWGHLKQLHYTLRLCKKALLEGNYIEQKVSPDLEARVYEKGELCAAFLWNNRTHEPQTINFRGKDYLLPEKSISILPDCKTVVFNTDYMVAQHSSRTFVPFDKGNNNLKWEKIQEHFPSKSTFKRNKARDQYDSTKDTTDYLWYTTSIELDNLDLPFKKSLQPVLLIISLGHSLLAFVNGNYAGTAHGSKSQPKFTFESAVRLKEGVNNITILSNTVGMPDSGANMEKRWSGVSVVEIQGLGTGNLDLTFNGWQHTIGLEGEAGKYYTEEGAKQVKWIPAKGPGRPLTWYKAYFDAPEGNDPLAINMLNMTKGIIFVNGHGIGRYWSSFQTVMGKPSQDQYHIPRAFVKPKDNLLVIFDEMGGNIDTVKIETVNRDIICSSVSEEMPPETNVWQMDDKGKLKAKNDTKPKIQLHCPDNKVITNIEFAQFGNPDGICGTYLPRCTAPNAQKVIEQRCLGKDTCIVPVDRELFDKNSCPEAKVKKLSVQAKCGIK